MAGSEKALHSLPTSPGVCPSAHPVGAPLARRPRPGPRRHSQFLEGKRMKEAATPARRRGSSKGSGAPPAAPSPGAS